MVPTYVTCFECGHVFPSAFALWWANLQVVWQGRASAVQWYGWRATLAMLLHHLLSRAGEIHSCPHCTHDF